MDCYVCNGHGEIPCNHGENKHSKQTVNSICKSGSESGFVICYYCEGLGSIKVID